jgi:hypothetical protein
VTHAEPRHSTDAISDDAPGATATAGGGANDVTGPEAAAHVDQAHAAPHGHVDEDTLHGATADEDEDRPPGPIDWAAWRAAIVGILVAVLICALLYLAIT